MMWLRKPNWLYRPLALTGLLLLAASPALGERSTIDLLKQQYAEFLLDSSPDDAEVTKYMQSLRQDGTWADIDYADKTRGNWQASHHLERIERMATAYRNPAGRLHLSDQLQKSVRDALQHWLDKDYINPNWYCNNIGTPRSVASILVLMGDALPKEMVDRAMNPILARSIIRMTGQNKVWLAGIVFLRSMINGDQEQMRVARGAIVSELRVSTREGVQPDWSFHQHGPQQQIGGYGKSFADSITQWALVFRGTPYAMKESEIAFLRNYLLQGPSWVMWRGALDISACGRQVGPNCQAQKGRDTLRQLRWMLRIDPAHAGQYQAMLDTNAPEGNNTFIGSKLFWRSDMMVHRRPQWYASVKMSSNRVIGAEAVNGENVSGLHLGDGALYVYQTGREYQNIQPLWDWHRLPGTTCDQSIEKLLPSDKRCRLATRFAGGVSDGQHGVAALDYQRDQLSARKAWFFLDDAVVCLGASITGKSSGSVLTSIEQSLMQGPVLSSMGELKPGKNALGAGQWICHGQTGYLLLDVESATVQTGRQEGNWKKVFDRSSTAPVAGDVFSLWIDHGQSPDAKSYAYAVFPRTDRAQMAERTTVPGFTILSNTKTIQAIKAGDDVQAVFYDAGKLELSAGRSLEVDRPCAVLMNSSLNGTRLFVADPSQQSQRLQLRVGGHSYLVVLPTGDKAGQTVDLAIQ